MKISIIIPAYNIAPYIGRCLESVLRQTFQEIEVIIVDDGSTDDTASKIKVYESKDRRIKLIQQENQGVTSARLTGIRNATGDYIGFVDGDDIIDPDMYEHLLNNAIKYHADISHCGYQMVFPNRVDYYYNTKRLVEQDNITGLRDLLAGSFIEPGLCNKLFHHKLFSKLLNNRLMDLKIKNNEDLLMNFFLFKESKLAIYEDWCPYHYMVRKNSASSASITPQKIMDPILVLKRIQTETMGERELEQIVLQRLVYQLVSVASEDMKHQKELIEIQHKARSELKIRLKEVIACPSFGKKYKIIAIWATVWPWSYGVIHKIYAHITGIDKRYSVD